MRTYSASHHFGRPVLLMTLATLIAFGGCRLSRSRPGSLPTRSDRLIQSFPELRAGRFAVIADFEDPVHMELVQLSGVSPQAQCVLEERGGQTDTGTRWLRFTASCPDDTLILSNDNATDWYLKRDWRDYDVLLIAIQSPRPNLNLTLAIAAGAGDERLVAESSWPLDPGRNVIRVDLGAVSEHIPLDDVQQIRFALTGATMPVEVYVDDIILTGSREDLFGDSRNREGNLYVQRVAQRLNIGAGGRFELTFANGQIIGWYNLTSDPYRLRNLVHGTTLGPIPVVLDPTDTTEGGFSALGRIVVARLRIVEMNAVRTVIACEWRFVNKPDEPLDDRPFQRWVYNIYATGQIYVTVECTTATLSWRAAALGLAVTFASTPEDEVTTHGATAKEPTGPAQTPVYSWAMNRSDNAFLVYVLGRPSPSARMVEQFDVSRGRTSLIALDDDDVDASVQVWRGHLLLATADDVVGDEPFARAIDYMHPARLNFEGGSPVLVGDASDECSGFDWGSGSFKIRPENGRVRLTFNGRKYPRFSPVFEIVDAESADAWVYVNHLVCKNVARNASGHVLFQLPGVIRDDTLVEVLFRPPQHSSGG